MAMWLNKHWLMNHKNGKRQQAGVSSTGVDSPMRSAAKKPNHNHTPTRNFKVKVTEKYIGGCGLLNSSSPTRNFEVQETEKYIGVCGLLNSSSPTRNFEVQETGKDIGGCGLLLNPSDPVFRKMSTSIMQTCLVPAEGVPPKPVVGGSRTLADALQYRDKLMPFADFSDLPTGPYETEGEIIVAVKLWASNALTQRGAFGIMKESLKPESKTHGVRRLLVCDRSGDAPKKISTGSRPNQISKKCNCPWGIWIERVKEGWITVELITWATSHLLETVSV